MEVRRPDWKVLATFAGAAAILTIGSTVLGQRWGYGYFIDELYYIACVHHLDFGYIDHPPLAPVILWVDLTVLGESLLAVRLPSAIAFALTAVLTGWITAVLGGGRFAQVLASVCALAAPLLVVLFSFYSMNAFEILLWTACLAVVVVMVERKDPRLWLAFGAVAGLALENKHTVVILALAVLGGLILTPERRLLKNRYLLAGGALAFLLFLPNLLWQVENGFPSLEFYRNAALLKNRDLTPLRVVWNQILFMNPFTLPVWGSGLYFCWWKRPSLRFLAWTYLLLLGTLAFSHSSRPDRIAGIYPALLAAGAVILEKTFFSPKTRALALALPLAGGVAFAPIMLPILPPATVARYVSFLGLDTQLERGSGKRAELPQWLADRFGWEELARVVRGVVESLPPSERNGATILAPSYGHAGALELLGRGELPPVISPHNTYFMWGRREVSRLASGVAISLGYDGEDLAPVYEHVERVATYECDVCMTWRNHMPVYVARGPKLDGEALRVFWQKFKHFE